jgi:hypothetical protein
LFPECREETPFIKAIRQKKPLPGAVGGAKKWRHAYGMPIPAACRMPQAMQHWFERGECSDKVLFAI